MQILFFSAPWCVSCGPTWENLNKAKIGNVTKSYRSVAEHEALAANWNVTGFPTLIAVDDNDTEIDRRTGAMTAGQIEKWIIGLGV